MPKTLSHGECNDWVRLVCPSAGPATSYGGRKRIFGRVFDEFGGYPGLGLAWSLMAEPWVEFDCDPQNMDARVRAYYQHPVRLLNGLIVERHELRLENRRQFTCWIVDQAPQRVAAFGGGFGGMSRLIGDALSNVQVEVVDPHPPRERGELFPYAGSPAEGWTAPISSQRSLRRRA